MSDDTKPPKQMVGGCCVCSDERGWPENPLVYCDGDSCSVAVHQACYGIMQVPSGSWFCRKCESQERAARVRCDLCPNKDGALKRTETGTWAHVVCALYIPEVRFGNNLTMEPIVLRYVPPERFTKSCYICEQQGRRSDGASGAGGRSGACMNCNKPGCRLAFHVTCAQSLGLLCEEEGNSRDNVKYCGYCSAHYPRKLRKGDVDGDGSCDSSDATGAGRNRKVDARNGPASVPSAVDVINGVAEPSVIEAANCLADMKRYDVSANRLSGDGHARTQPVAAAPAQMTSSSSLTPPNGDWTGDGAVPAASLSAAGQGSDQSSLCKGDRPANQAACIASAIDGRSATPQSDIASPSESGRGLAKPTRRLGGTQQPRRRNSAATARISREVPSPASSGGPAKSAKRQKLQRLAAGEPAPLAIPSRCGTAASSGRAAASVSNGPPAVPDSERLQPRQAPASYESSSRSGAVGGEEQQQPSRSVPSAASPVPQSMQQLLEQQFEQGSQFLMEQAQYFDIASLLRCVAQLQAENKQLEETVRGLGARRDHLASVNARLSLSLGVTPGALTAAAGAVGGPVPIGVATALGPRPALQSLSPRLSPRGSGDMPAGGPLPVMLQPAAAGPSVALVVAQPGVASLPGYVQALPSSAQPLMDHHFHQQQQQQFMMQQQQQQLQHMMLMAQAHAGGAVIMPPSAAVTGGVVTNVHPNLVVPVNVAASAGGVVAPTPHGVAAAAAAQLQPNAAAAGEQSSVISGHSYTLGAAHHVHLLPPANIAAAGIATPSPATVGTAAPTCSAAGAASSGHPGTFSPTSTKLQKSDRKAS